MTTKTKLLSVLSAAMCLAIGTSALVACTPAEEGKPDNPDEPGVTYLNTADLGEKSSASTVGKTWTQLSATTVGDIGKGTELVFQFYANNFDMYSSYTPAEGQGPDATPAAYGDAVEGVKGSVLLNLYKDGTAVALQALKVEDSATVEIDDANWWNKNSGIYTVMFGWWIGGYDGSGAMSQGYALKVALSSKLNASWEITNDTKTPESTDGAYAIEINAIKDGDKTNPESPTKLDANGNPTFQYNYSAKRYLGLLGLDGKEAWYDETQTGIDMEANLSNAPKYSTIQNWLNEIGVGGGGPQG